MHNRTGVASFGCSKCPIGFDDLTFLFDGEGQALSIMPGCPQKNVPIALFLADTKVRCTTNLQTVWGFRQYRRTAEEGQLSHHNRVSEYGDVILARNTLGSDTDASEIRAAIGER